MKPRSRDTAVAACTPAGKRTLTATGGTGKPQAAQTGDPERPARTDTEKPAQAASEAKRAAKACDANGTNRQAGAGCQPDPAGRARQAQTQPRPRRRATTPATRREPGTETKREHMTHPQDPEKRKTHTAEGTAEGAPERAAGTAGTPPPPAARRREGGQPFTL